MEIQLKLYGSSKILSDKDTLSIQLPNNSNIKKLRDVLTKIISEKHSKTNLKSLPKNQLKKISKQSLVREKIKKIELSKFYDLKAADKYSEQVLRDFYKRLNFKNLNKKA